MIYKCLKYDMRIIYTYSYYILKTCRCWRTRLNGASFFTKYFYHLHVIGVRYIMVHSFSKLLLNDKIYSNKFKFQPLVPTYKYKQHSLLYKERLPILWGIYILM